MLDIQFTGKIEQLAAVEESLLQIMTETFTSVKEFRINIEEIQQLELVSTEVRTASNNKRLYCCCYLPPNADLLWTYAHLPPF